MVYSMAGPVSGAWKRDEELQGLERIADGGFKVVCSVDENNVTSSGVLE